MSKTITELSNTLMRRQSWPPFLIGIGSFAFFSIIMKDTQNPTTMHYMATGIAVLLIVTGIIMMFYQLRNDETVVESDSLPEGTAQPEHAVVQLSKNYEILRRQTTQGFIMSGIFMALGFLVILAGSAGALFGLTNQGSQLTTVAGVIMEFISGTSLLIYRINFKRLNETTDKLDRTWNILTAYRLTDGLPEDKKAEATMRLIESLIVNARPNNSFNRSAG
jgi:uncharacterized membrane protein